MFRTDLYKNEFNSLISTEKKSKKWHKKLSILLLSSFLVTGCNSSEETSHDKNKAEFQYNIIPYNEVSYLKLDYFSHFVSTSSSTTLFNSSHNFYTINQLQLNNFDGNYFFHDTDDKLPLERAAVGIIFQKAEHQDIKGSDLVRNMQADIENALNASLSNIGTSQLQQTNTGIGKFKLNLATPTRITSLINNIVSNKNLIGNEINPHDLPNPTNIEIISDRYNFYITVKQIDYEKYVYIISASPYTTSGHDDNLMVVQDSTNTF